MRRPRRPGNVTPLLAALHGLRLLAGPLSAQAVPPGPADPVLDIRALLSRQAWRDNLDLQWFAERIPAFESPDSAIDATYYYRWELVTKHLTYGSPETGYTLTEFIDRPYWSGTYGAISCPLGHQIEEIRWLDDRRIIEDFTRYWFETPGARPRGYSNWYGAAVWGAYEVLGDSAFLRRMLPLMKQQYAGWMSERWDPVHRMFRWDGLHDGMERNINSRQTDDIDAGAEGYRPTLNSYLFADARGIALASAVLGDTAAARDFTARAVALRERVLTELWDERRTFFLHQSARDENGGVRARTRTYDSGRYAGSPHGRELIGYVPWQFQLPPPGRGYERAWRYLMDTAYFMAPYGPTTTERHDPQFHVSPTCCWWSGNSWPYATTQTLVALANLLNSDPQRVVGPADWMTLFSIYTRTQRKGGRPYVAEAANPDNGSWEGHDTPWHSEHYFHSGYVNLLITGLVGLRPRADDTLEVNPLAPTTWPWFALHGVRYHGRRVSVLWDRDGARYGRGPGLLLLADGEVIARAPGLGRLVAHLGPSRPATPGPRQINLAVNNGRGAYPRVTASYAAPEHPPIWLLDGNYWYHREPANRWTTLGTPNARDTVTLDFGIERQVERVALYILDDGAGGGVRPPARVDLEMWHGDRWVEVPSQRRDPAQPVGRRANHVRFPEVTTSRLRVVLTPRPGSAVGLTELEAWGAASVSPLPAATAPAWDLAHNPTGAGYPRVSASFTAAGEHVGQVNDLRFAFTRYSRNRWTAAGSPHPTDWVEVDFGTPQRVTTVELYLYGNDRDIRAPRRFQVEIWNGRAWEPARVLSRLPGAPRASARNLVVIQPVETSRVRVLLVHDLPAFSGITELIIHAGNEAEA